MMVNEVEQSLVIIKPDGTVRRTVSAFVLKALLERGYRIRAFKEMDVSKDLAEMHYAVHKEKPFFPWLVDFISSAPVLTMILEGDGVIQGVREALGATFVQKAEPDTLRGKYGIWAGINIAHASDAPGTAKDEIALWTEVGGVKLSDEALSKANEYIERYITGDADHTMEIRNIVKGSIERQDLSSDITKALAALFGKDADGISEAAISTLASVVFDFIKEEVEKE
jgi:nucleoside-diphosphate kinase